MKWKNNSGLAGTMLIMIAGGIMIAFSINGNTGRKAIHQPGAMDRPNIILFYADDLGWTDLGVQGSDFYESAAIDRIANGGMKFTQAYANAANCAPSRACLISGLYTPRHGVYTVSNADRGKSSERKLIPVRNTTVLNRKFKTLPEVLKKHGYATCIAGKWHLSDDPIPYGFDINFGGGERGAPGSYFSPYNNPALPDGPAGEHLPDRLSTEVSHWIRENAGNPFFVYFPFYSVHSPIRARKDLTEKYARKAPGKFHDHPKYAAMIEAMDQAVQKVMHTLEELDLDDNTLVIFTSDNGPYGRASVAKPLRGGKGMFYEGGIRVPFFVKWPGVISPGTVSDEPVIGLDIFPTLLEATHISTDMALDGKSLLPVLKGSKTPMERALYWHFPAYLQMYKADRGFGDSHDAPYWRTTPCGVIREGDWKLIEYFESGDIELYNLKNDPGEKNDLSKIEADKTARMYAKLRAWQKQTNSPIPETLNPDYKH
ncbi:sulfatase [Fulvivirga sp. M361]|uniref:sulfatase n=1 Tax=Fulvivirga sp. M361 TaxID=2594266 RepID=UPI00117ADB64|nr:sulfatase [Fulvivirga sp. M361]TRX59175.1 sulfatase [Fulvivirga sp. M361]